MTRRTAYFSALKYHFQALLVERQHLGTRNLLGYRGCYKLAKRRAAEFAFRIPTRSLYPADLFESSHKE
jgi:hypothetical protein